MFSPLTRSFSTIIISAALLAGCADRIADPANRRLDSSTLAPLACPTNVTQTTTQVISPLGGVISLSGTTVTVPASALDLPTVITVTLPASNYMEVDITANGLLHFEFGLPITVSFSYARCSRGNLDKGPLSVWYWDGGTLLQNMNGVDDKDARTVTFSTNHLSGYVIAN